MAGTLPDTTTHDEDNTMSTKQAITSADTSLNQVPALHRWFVTRTLASGYPYMGDAVVDFGAGKYDAAGDYITAQLGVPYFPHDPYNRTAMENQTALDACKVLNTTGLCANVLNVIAEPEARAELIQLAADSVNGAVLFSVYEGDRSGTGRRTTKGWQNNRKLADYVPELRAAFAKVDRVGTVLVCSN